MEQIDEGDLLIVVGTALAVQPFNTIVSRMKPTTPKVLFNMNNTDETAMIDFDKPEFQRIFV